MNVDELEIRSKLEPRSNAKGANQKSCERALRGELHATGAEGILPTGKFLSRLERKRQKLEISCWFA